MSTRESEKTRTDCLKLGLSQVSGASCTSVGGYAEKEKENTAQFEVNDTRTLDEVVNWLLKLGYIPSFCTACYREGRTGDRFMQLVKSGAIANVCHPNAIMTLKEYLEDYATEGTRENGEQMIAAEVEKLANTDVKRIVKEHLGELHQGKRDFRF
jgi:2-iminoacetate synthase